MHVHTHVAIAEVSLVINIMHTCTSLVCTVHAAGVLFTCGTLSV